MKKIALILVFGLGLASGPAARADELVTSFETTSVCMKLPQTSMLGCTYLMGTAAKRGTVTKTMMIALEHMAKYPDCSNHGDATVSCLQTMAEFKKTTSWMLER